MSGDPRCRPRIGIDYTAAATHAPGVGRYVREVVRALVRLEECPSLVLFEGGRGPRPMEGAPLGLEHAPARVLRRRFPLPRRTFGWLERCGLDVARLIGGVDVFHRAQPGFPPLRGVRDVLPVGELPAEGTREDARLASSARAAAGCVVFSRAYADALHSRYGIAADRIHVVPVGAEHWLRDLGSAPARARSGVPEILVLGAVRAHRRPLTALAGFGLLRARGSPARITFVGARGDAEDAFRSALGTSAYRADVRWIEHPRETDMPALVAGADVLLHLSLDEGSAVTPLEACVLGPALALERLPAFEEVLGSTATWIERDPGPDAVAAALERALGEDLDDQERAARRRALGARFTWAAAARAHVAAWQAVGRL